MAGSAPDIIPSMQPLFSGRSIQTASTNGRLAAQAAVLLFTLLILALGGTACSRADGPTEVAYIGWDDAGIAQLFITSGAGKARQLTALSADVLDFAPNRKGDAFLVAVANKQGGSDLVLLHKRGGATRQVLSCGADLCADITWSASDRRTMLERRPTTAGGLHAAPELMWLEVDSGATLPVLADVGEKAGSGRLSHDEEWLSYVSPRDEGLVIYNLVDGRRQFILNEIGTLATWSPVAAELVVPQLDLVVVHGAEGEDHDSHSHDYLTAVHLLHVDPAGDTKRSLSGDLNVEDSAPAWSPDGEWLAFGRRVPRTDAPRQLWLMRTDGSDARAVAAEEGVDYGPPQWTPDGRGLVFQRFQRDEPQAEPAIWHLDLASGALTELAAAGMLPRVLGW